MSLTSYRTAPPRGCGVGCWLCGGCHCGGEGVLRVLCAWKAWRRPTLPRLETQYHWRGGVSRPSSGWDRVFLPRCDHQAVEAHGALGYEIVCLCVWRMCDPSVCQGSSLRTEDQAYRAISTGQLHVLPRFHIRPIDVVVFHGSQGNLVLRGASRLDAFSGYLVRT